MRELRPNKPHFPGDVVTSWGGEGSGVYLHTPTPPTQEEMEAAQARAAILDRRAALLHRRAAPRRRSEILLAAVRATHSQRTPGG